MMSGYFPVETRFSEPSDEKQKKMLAANYSEFRNNLRKFLDAVEMNNETLVLKRSKGKGAVIISLEEYNSMMETLHLLKSGKNAERLFESIEQVRKGKVVTKDLIEE